MKLYGVWNSYDNAGPRNIRGTGTEDEWDKVGAIPDGIIPHNVEDGTEWEDGKKMVTKSFPGTKANVEHVVKRVDVGASDISDNIDYSGQTFTDWMSGKRDNMPAGPVDHGAE